jgi:hypothetical protein
MPLTREQGEEYVETIKAMTAILDEARGNPDVWLRRREEHRALEKRLDELTGNIKPWSEWTSMDDDQDVLELARDEGFELIERQVAAQWTVG